jgi:hypothetical protein
MTTKERSYFWRPTVPEKTDQLKAFPRFAELAKKLTSVSKREVDQKRAEKRKRRERPTREPRA